VSFKWPNKDKDEVLDYSVDWSRFLGGATITSVSWFVDNADGVKTSIPNGAVVNGIQNVSTSVVGGVTTINLGLGDNNKEYKFYCQIQDSTGSTAERVIKLNIKEQ
jgi:uncharacterized membrane protein